jgi:hypothetical protein
MSRRRTTSTSVTITTGRMPSSDEIILSSMLTALTLDQGHRIVRFLMLHAELGSDSSGENSRSDLTSIDENSRYYYADYNTTFLSSLLYKTRADSPALGGCATSNPSRLGTTIPGYPAFVVMPQSLAHISPALFAKGGMRHVQPVTLGHDDPRIPRVRCYAAIPGTHPHPHVARVAPEDAGDYQ